MSSPQDGERLEQLLEARQDYLASAIPCGDAANQMAEAVFALIEARTTKRQAPLTLLKERAAAYSTANRAVAEKAKLLSDHGEWQPDMRLVRPLVTIPKLGDRRLRDLAATPSRALPEALSAWQARFRVLRVIPAYAQVRDDAARFMAARGPVETWAGALAQVGQENELIAELAKQFGQVDGAQRAYEMACGRHARDKWKWEARFQAGAISLIDLLVAKDVRKEWDDLEVDNARLAKALIGKKQGSRLFWLSDP